MKGKVIFQTREQLATAFAVSMTNGCTAYYIQKAGEYYDLYELNPSIDRLVPEFIITFTAGLLPVLNEWFSTGLPGDDDVDEHTESSVLLCWYKPEKLIWAEYEEEVERKQLVENRLRKLTLLVED